MPQLTIAERQILVEQYLKVINREEIMDVVLSQEPLMNIIRVISGIGQEILISLFGNMLPRLEVYVDQNG